MSYINNIRKYLIILRFVLIILFFNNIFQAHNFKELPGLAFFTLCLFVISNDAIRSLIKKSNNIWYYFSLALSLVGAATLKYFINDFKTNTYLFFYVIEILYIQGKYKQFFLVLHGISYLISAFLTTRALNYTTRLTELGTSFLSYSSILCILYLAHAVRNEREGTKKLNDELKSSNIKLQEYSLKVEELTIAKERQRMAQELHDSLGHSLMALTMHLEFAEKIFDTMPEKAKEVILKAKKISKDSTASLRMAVDALKIDRNIEDLSEAIQRMIDSFEILGTTKIAFRIDKLLEALNPDIKLCIYKTVRESLTNAMKHGNATAFNLEVGILDNHVNMIIQDNGIGCEAIIRSNGLHGIEDRVFALGGTVKFTSRENLGFLTMVEIPIY
ncbi:sensor histidine kinase [Desulfosporosinus sp. OT]|uniref:sensor histidine kinase n=1 Tax=Desulfosporosinus sp. OT TaxID=913865 RepID=UPI000223A86B|nr:sensor histidine kinase [Desulfosporosinus sp. OT]EGW41257.1 histidine kinase-, DNA gyrase B-, and HSP90-like ATPase family protein [Desulfosporosinus sp. OT]